MDIKEVLCGLETLKFEVSSADGAKVLERAIEVIVKLDACNKTAHSDIALLREDNIFLKDNLKYQKECVAKAKEKLITAHKKLQSLKESIKAADQFFSEGDFASGIAVIVRLTKETECE